MLHLSFTQQLCHVAKIKVGNAANDAIFGSLNADEEKLCIRSRQMFLIQPIQLFATWPSACSITRLKRP
jgi:hypothetical protein